MQLLENQRDKKIIVRIIIGTSSTGSSKIKAPTKTISLIDTDVPKVYELLIKFLRAKHD